MPTRTEMHKSKDGRAAFNIAMVSDFFYPNMGGVESHIYHLAQCLVRLGHKVVIITHGYGNRNGVRYLSSCMKVYYLPFAVFHNQCTFPTLFTTFRFMRNIFVREEIEIVHGHSAFSTLCHDALLHAQTMGVSTVFTDHSLFGFADPSSIITNKFLEFSMTNVDHVVCVSNTSKENTVLRASLDAYKVSVIPNAVDSDLFKPMSAKKSHDQITIVVASRLVYRKGIYLLAGLIPRVCSKHSNVNFAIGGDGPKRILLEEVRENYCLQDRVFLFGNLCQSQVKDLLVQGDIFLNTSLTEAFCMAILEAASCGLQVVSTNVGGIPEVLPPKLIRLADPTINALESALEDAILASSTAKSCDISEEYRTLKRVYTWRSVAGRTERVYQTISKSQPKCLKTRLRKYLMVAPVAGKLYCLLIIMDTIILVLFDFFFPREHIDRCPHYDV